MNTINKLKLGVSLLVIFFSISITAQTQQQADIISSLYEAYKEKGVQEVLKVYEKNNSQPDYEGMAEPLNIMAYRLMQEENDLKGAEILLKAQIEEYPEEANPYDSYSDLLIEMDKKEEALKYIEKSLAIAEKRDHEQDDLLIEAGKAKLAIMENKDKQLKFLVGKWDNETKTYQNGQEINSSSSMNEITFDPNGSILSVDHRLPGNKPCCRRIMVYNPVDDEFDVSYFRNDQPNGIHPSKLKLTELAPGHYEMIETYMNDDHQETEARHDIKKNENLIEWVIYDGTDNGWEKVRSMNLKKKA